MMSMLRHWWQPLLSGVLIGTSYIPFPPWASLFCFVPLWLFWLRQQRVRQVLLGGVVTAFVFTLIGFNWVTYVLHEFAHLDWPVAVFGMVLFALLAHLFVPLAGWLWFMGRRRFGWSPSVSVTALALITTLCEAHGPTLFDWNFGYTWYGSEVPLFQWAEVVGFSGLSALTVLANLPLLRAWQLRRQAAGWRWLAAVMAVFGLLNVGGVWLERRLPTPDAQLRVALVQGNIGNFEKLSAELGRGFQDGILKAYMAATDRALAGVTGSLDFVVWPETAFPALLGERLRPTPYSEALSAFLHDRKLPLVTGAYGIDTASGLLTNSLFVLDASGALLSPHYSKTILLAFGEYLPGEQWFPRLREWLPPTGQFARGAGPTTVLALNGLRMGPQICYESLFPGFSRSLADLGAQFIVNATNDSWYGTWQEPWQHMRMTLARGVELRRPVLRSTNTGISTVGLASGKVLEQSPLHAVWAGVYEVPYLKQPPVTFYQSTGWWGVPLLLWSSLLGVLVWGMRRR